MEKVFDVHGLPLVRFSAGAAALVRSAGNTSENRKSKQLFDAKLAEAKRSARGEGHSVNAIRRAQRNGGDVLGFRRQEPHTKTRSRRS